MGERSQSVTQVGSMFAARLSPPELPHGHVGRTSLLEVLSEQGDGGLVSITAPAGYGKTTLLAEWARAEERPVAWVTLDSADNDPMMLMGAVAESFGRAQGLESSFWESMSSPGGSVLRRLGPRLADAMRSPSHPFVLVLDDVHEVSAAAGQDVVDLLVGRVPPRSTFAVAGRSEPPSLPAWRVDRDMLELGAEHLAFDADEAARLLHLGGAHVAPEVVDDLHAGLEGWVAGLQLALVVARQERFAGFDVRDRFVADYLRHEVLDGMAGEDHEFLTRTAVLDELSGAVCDAVLGIEGSAARLHELEQAGLFLVPLDRQRSRYRYHAAFRELLLAEFDRSHGNAARRRLHRRASEWYDEREFQQDAVEHALRSGDPAWTARLLAKVALQVTARGRIATMRRWLDEFGDDAVLGYPPLAVVAGWAAAYSGDAVNAERWLARLDGLSFDGLPADGSASFSSARAMFRGFACAHGPEAMLEDAELAMAAEATWGRWRSTAEALGAEAHLLGGRDSDRVAAWSLFSDAIDSSRAANTTDCLVVCLAERALLAMDRGERAAARQDVAEALAVIEQCYMEDYLTSLLAFAAGARLALHDGDATRAGGLATRAMRARGIATHAVPYWAVRLRLVLARVHLALGEVVAARHLLQEADDVLRRRPELGSLVDETERVRDLVASAPSQGGSSPLSPAELRVLPYLQTHLTFDEIAERLFLSLNTVRSHARAIYRKLGATSRGEAVAAATALGLLGELGVDVTA